MAQEFFIKKGSVNPILRMELVHDGRYNYSKFWDVIQDSDVTFTMINTATGIKKVVNAPAEIRYKEDSTCEDEYLICYQWKMRDTMIPGIYDGVFNINFNGDIKEDGVVFPIGNLIMPICEPLTIYII